MAQHEHNRNHVVAWERKFILEISPVSLTGASSIFSEHIPPNELSIVLFLIYSRKWVSTVFVAYYLRFGDRTGYLFFFRSPKQRDGLAYLLQKLYLNERLTNKIDNIKLGPAHDQLGYVQEVAKRWSGPGPSEFINSPSPD